MKNTCDGEIYGAESAGCRSSGSADRGIPFKAAFIMSAFGNEFLFFVMTLRVYALSGRAMDVGIFTALTFVPKFGSPVFGSLVDCFGSRRVLVCACAGVALLTLVLPFVGDFLFLYVIWFFQSALFILIGNARTVLLNELTGDTGYATSNSQVLAFLTLTRLSAPVAAGFLSRSSGELFLIPAAVSVYIVASGAALAIKNSPADNGIKRKAPLRLFSFEGFRSLWRSRDLRILTCIGIIWRLCLGFFFSSLIGHLSLYAGVVAMHARRDQAAAPALRGRVYGANTAVLTPAAVVSMLAGGILIDVFGVRVVYFAGGLAAMLSIGAIFCCIAAGRCIRRRKNVRRDSKLIVYNCSNKGYPS